MTQASSVALAGGATTHALIDVLMRKGIITNKEAADIGYRAQNLLKDDSSAEASEACRMIDEMLIGHRP